MTDKHQQKMAAKKAVMDAKIAKATEERGILILMKGNGKGKSSSAFGTLARSLGHGKRCAVVQFLKGRNETGEYKFFRDHPMVDWHVMGDGFTWETQDRERDVAAAMAAWEKAKELIRNPAYHMVLLDEINIALRYGYIDLGEVLSFLETEKPEMTHVVLTGRNAAEDLIEQADLVTEMTLIKHPFRSGIKAQIGVEF